MRDAAGAAACREGKNDSQDGRETEGGGAGVSTFRHQPVGLRLTTLTTLTAAQVAVGDPIKISTSPRLGALGLASANVPAVDPLC